jgi:hypothetical protein
MLGAYLRHLLGFEPDFVATNAEGTRAKGIAWTHRKGEGFDIYFISNQKDSAQMVNVSLRVNGKIPELFDPVTGHIQQARRWKIEYGRTELPIFLDKNASVFVVLQQSTKLASGNAGNNKVAPKTIQTIDGSWTVQFNPQLGGPKAPITFSLLTDWSMNADSSIKYYSGTAIYSKKIFYRPAKKHGKIWLNIGTVRNLADVYINNNFCGTIWTAPFHIDITRALREGENTIRIEVVNTWNNRLVGDSRLEPGKRITSTSYPFRMEGKPLLPAGLLGPVVIEVSDK